MGNEVGKEAPKAATPNQSEGTTVKEVLNVKEYWRMKEDLWKLADNIGTITFKSVMGTDKGSELSKKSYPIGPDGKRLKPCCACPETKRARDACVIEKGEENCTELIEAHKACMRSLGFNI